MSCVIQRGHSGDGCELASILCKYGLIKGDLFVLNWARMRQVMQGSVSSELLMCRGRMFVVYRAMLNIVYL